MVCMCGYVIEGDDDEEFWSNAQGHMGVPGQNGGLAGSAP
jgi:hypothetical protein